MGYCFSKCLLYKHNFKFWRLVKYKDGEKKVSVTPDTPIVTFVAGDKSELKPGAKVIIFGVVKKEDGALEANRVNVGRDGVTPPM